MLPRPVSPFATCNGRLHAETFLQMSLLIVSVNVKGIGNFSMSNRLYFSVLINVDSLVFQYQL